MIHRLCFIAMTVILSACVSVLPQQVAPDALYRIPAPEQQPALTADVLVHEPDAPRVFAGRAIASEADDGGLKLVPGVEWADRATRLLQDTLIDSFDPGSSGRAVTAGGLTSAHYELDWRIVDFHLTGEGGVCRLVVSFFDARSRTIVARETIDVAVPARASGNGARMDALKSAATDCVARTADFVVRAQQAPLPNDQAASVRAPSGKGR